MSRGALAWLALLALAAPLLGSFVSCHRHVEAARSEMDVAWERLAAFDEARRAKTDFAKLATWDRLSGPDPYAIRQLPGAAAFAGVLRGSDAVVVLDPSLREVQRLESPRDPVGLAVADDGTVFVAGELATALARFDWKNGALTPSGSFETGVRAIRDLAAGPNGWVYVVEEERGRLHAFRIERGKRVERVGPITEVELGNGPVRLERVGDVLVVDCLLDHALVFLRLEKSGAPSALPPLRIRHDGPIWSFAARPIVGKGHELLVAAGGVEDHPLDRTVGAFGYVDSFLFLYRVDVESGETKREAAINLSELGVVTPKAITLATSPSVVVNGTGYGSDKLVRLEFDADLSRAPRVVVAPFVPGATAVAESSGRLVFADPLLDAWVGVTPAQAGDREASPQVAPVLSTAVRSGDIERLGEALFFTTLMAPFNRSDGALSRFTCETCHFEGYVDGRTHHTGRGDVHAVTKPLLGLWNNRPHFSRALDDDLVTVAFNEFRVAGAKSDHDPWFTLRASDAPWLAWLGQQQAETLSPELLRKGLMSFLMAFNHRPNPAVLGRASFSDGERAGAAVFRDRCESCHEARLAGDQPSSRVPFDRWESLVMAPEGAIVWGKAEYQKTGIEPYVHEKGARVPSLRRLYKKRPYFTNGSAKDLADVVGRARFLPEGFLHTPPVPDRGAMLDDPSRAALLGFLRLL